MVRVWKTNSLLLSFRYDQLIVVRRQNHVIFIFIKMMSHDFLVQWPIIFLRRYKKFAALFFLLAGNKEFQRGQMCSHTHMLQMQMRRNEHGTYSTHTARGFSILYYVFSRKQFILCSALRISVALHYSMLHTLGNFDLKFGQLFAAARRIGSMWIKKKWRLKGNLTKWILLVVLKEP